MSVGGLIFTADNVVGQGAATFVRYMAIVAPSLFIFFGLTLVLPSFLVTRAAAKRVPELRDRVLNLDWKEFDKRFYHGDFFRPQTTLYERRA